MNMEWNVAGMHLRGASEELGCLFGSLSLLKDGKSADHAALEDFLASVDAVLSDDVKVGYDDAAFRIS